MEPSLTEIPAAGRLNREVFARITRRVDHLLASSQLSYDYYGISLPKAVRDQPPVQAAAPLRLDAAYWSGLIQKIESISKINPGVIRSRIVLEPPLTVPSPPYRMHRAALNRIIRRIEALTDWLRPQFSGIGINV